MLRTALVIATVCATGIVIYSPSVRAQCAARDALNTPRQKPLRLLRPRPCTKRRPFRTCGRLWHWGNLQIRLHFAMHWMPRTCGIGDLAGEALARPAFKLASIKTEVDLVVLSPAELGLTAEFVSLRDIYDRAEKLGLFLAPAEVGPALRLQYRDQPIGEFLHIGMKPIVTWLR